MEAEGDGVLLGVSVDLKHHSFTVYTRSLTAGMQICHIQTTGLQHHGERMSDSEGGWATSG